MQKAAIAQGLSVMTFTIGPIFITIAAFVVYGAMGKTLSASVAFPAIALFNLLRFPILLLPMQILNIINCKVRAASLLCMLRVLLTRINPIGCGLTDELYYLLQVSMKRLQDYLKLEEIKDVEKLPPAGAPAATAQPPPPVLVNHYYVDVS